MPYKPKVHRPPGHRTERERRREFDRTRADKAHHAFYSSKRWRRFRGWFLARHPVCQCGEPATVVDHQAETKDRPDLSLSEDNCRPACVRCHNAKTARGQHAKRAIKLQA